MIPFRLKEMKEIPFLLEHQLERFPVLLEYFHKMIREQNDNFLIMTFKKQEIKQFYRTKKIKKVKDQNHIV